MRNPVFLSTGKMRVPAFVFSESPVRALTKSVTLSATIGVVERTNGDIVLVDVGWSEATCQNPAGELGWLKAKSLGVVVRAGDSALAQLSARGISADRVTHIVATHLHLDHVGGAVDFPNAEVVCGASEYPAWKAKKGNGYRPADLEKSGKIRPVEASTPVDLFGDGSIVLRDGSGHTAGSLLVALGTPERRFLHVGDAVYQTWELTENRPTLFANVLAFERPKLTRVYDQIRALEATGLTVVPSHDDVVFQGLPRG